MRQPKWSGVEGLCFSWLIIQGLSFCDDECMPVKIETNEWTETSCFLLTDEPLSVLLRKFFIKGNGLSEMEETTTLPLYLTGKWLVLGKTKVIHTETSK
jgi:hypothetical protein